MVVILKGLGNMAKQVTNAVLAEKIDTLVTKVSAVEHHLVGNGKPGLLTRMAVMEQNEAGRMMYRKMVVGSTLTAIAALGVALLGKLF